MRQQHGSALIISLLILLVMTIIGISAMSSSTMEEKMAANDRNQKAIFQNAESVLVTANTATLAKDYATLRTELQRLDSSSPTIGLLNQDDTAFDPLNPSEWVPDTSCTAINNNSNNSGKSCYVIQAVQQAGPNVETRDYDNPTTTQADTLNIKVTVRSTDANGVSTVTLQNGLKKTTTN